MSKLLDYFCMLWVAELPDGLFALLKYDWDVLDA
jgi:hypothetical protein